jgi:hypothetical protein
MSNESKQSIIRFSADAAKDYICLTLADGRVFEGRKAMRDVQVSWKRHFDSYMGWISVEDKVWFDEGRAERLYNERMIAKGVFTF